MITTVLFDLDGTLLPIELDDFQNVYFEALTTKLNDIVGPKQLIKMIMASTKAVVDNTDKVKNEVVFMDALKSFVGEDNLKVYQERFIDFYNNEFSVLKTVINPNQHMIEAVSLLKEKGYDLIVATNPLFPKIAIEKRIRWAGFDVSDFTYITSFEDNHYCKPHPIYYQEILDETNKNPKECMMVGNDRLEDLIAAKLGIKTYLITDHLIERDVDLMPDHTGRYEDFLHYVKNMPDVNNKGE